MERSPSRQAQETRVGCKYPGVAGKGPYIGGHITEAKHAADEHDSDEDSIVEDEQDDDIKQKSRRDGVIEAIRARYGFGSKKELDQQMEVIKEYIQRNYGRTFNKKPHIIEALSQMMVKEPRLERIDDYARFAQLVESCAHDVRSERAVKSVKEKKEREGKEGEKKD